MNGHLARIAGSPEMVEVVQRKLQSQGLYLGPCDGRVNDETQAAFAKFMAAARLDKPDAGFQQIWEALCREGGFTFADVLRDELAQLRPGRASPGPAPAPGAQVNAAAHLAGLAGLALSGGGVRSATFNLGILQAAAQAGLLHRFDYLSTVSGGGYIGGWLSRWIGEQPAGIMGVEAVLAQTSAPCCEPRQVKYLRQYSNYLTPRVGMFSADTWAFLATYLRNAGLNLLILGAGLAALLLLPRLWTAAVVHWHARYGPAFMWSGIAAFLLAVFHIAFGLSRVPDPASKKVQGQGWVLWSIVVPLLAAAAAGSVALWQYRGVISAPWTAVREHGFHWAAFVGGFRQAFPYATEDQVVLGLLAPGLVYFAVWACGWASAQLGNRARLGARYQQPKHILLQGLGHLLCAIGALAVATAMVAATAIALPASEVFLGHVASFGMPFLLAIFGVTMVLMIGLIGRLYSDSSREWWSRQGGWTIIFVLAWTALFLFSIYSPVLLAWADAHVYDWAKGAIAAGWVGSAWASLWAATQPASARPGADGYLKWLAMLAPPLVLVGILALLSSAIFAALAPTGPLPAPPGLAAQLERQMQATVATPPASLGWALLACVLVFLLFAWRVDVNKFSLYMMYRNRLVRAYLGAIRSRRAPHPFTGFDVDDDIALHEIAGQRPYHIVNAALNLVKGKELAWQTRKAANFVFTPRFCGYETPRMRVSDTAQASDESARGMFRPTQQYGVRLAGTEATEKGVKLGMAMAISGAASGPDLGFHSSPVLTFLMTLFNVRLGRWCGNPCTPQAWKRASPGAGFLYLVKELLGFTDASSAFLYLSDGGHFDNLGIYELVRRRCRLIVAVDASADGALHFADLGNAVRKCYTDFNIEIEIDVKAIERLPSGFSGACAAAGKIRYRTPDPQAPGKTLPDGTLLLIKPALLGDEFVEIYNYHQANQEFPHQSTADQWFDENQFESYRALGKHIGDAVFGRLAPALAREPWDIGQVCAAIEHDWLAAPRKLPPRPIRQPSARTTRKPTMSLHRPAEKPLRSAERR